MNAMIRTKQFCAQAGLLLVLVSGSLTGCVGVEGSAYVGDDYVGGYVPGPDVYVFGGYGRGHFDRDAGRRGAESRRAVVGHGNVRRDEHRR